MVIALSILLAARKVCQQETNFNWFEFDSMSSICHGSSQGTDRLGTCIILAVSIRKLKINIQGLRFWARSWRFGISSSLLLDFRDFRNAWTESATLQD